MQLQIGDCFTHEEGEWEILTHSPPPEAEDAAGTTGHAAWRVTPRVWRAVPSYRARGGDKKQKVLVSRRDRSRPAKNFNSEAPCEPSIN